MDTQHRLESGLSYVRSIPWRELTGISGIPSGFPYPCSSHALRQAGGTKWACVSMRPIFPHGVDQDGDEVRRRLSESRLLKVRESAIAF